MVNKVCLQLLNNVIDKAGTSSLGHRPGKEPINDEDPDFMEEGGQKNRGPNKEKETEAGDDEKPLQKNKVKKDNFPRIKTRTSPNMLSYTIERMNAAQIQAIKDIGFGFMLEMKHTDVPCKMLYWLVDNFNPRRCAIQLHEGRTLSVTAEDVHLMLGLPMGKVDIKKRVTTKDSKLVDDWKKLMNPYLEEGKKVIKPITVSAAMLADVEASPWFSRNFILLMSCCLIESSSNGSTSATVQIMDCFEEIENIKNLKWCDFVVKALVETTHVWKSAKEQWFTGPSLFLTLLYADRVTDGYREIERCVPAFVNWYDHLHERQRHEIMLGKFGDGYIDPPFQPSEPVEVAPNVVNQPPANLDHREDDAPNVKDMDNQKATEYMDEPESSNRVQLITKKVATLGKKIVDYMAEIMAIVQDAPDEVKTNLVFKKTLEASIIASRPDTPEGIQLTQVSQDDNDFWDNPKIIEELNELEAISIKMWLFRKGVEAPSSDQLGTQTDRNMNDVQQDANKHQDNENYNLDNDGYSEVPSDMVVEPIVQSDVTTHKIVVPTTETTPISVQQPLVNALLQGQRETTPSNKVGNASVSGKKNKRQKEPSNIDEAANALNTYKVAGVACDRGKRTIKKAEIFGSPWCNRAINMQDKVDKHGKILYAWLMNSTISYEEEFVFISNSVEIPREELTTLAPNRYVHSSVIDAWCGILNRNEELKDPLSPHRFFATTYPCFKTVMEPPENWAYDEIYIEFSDRLEEEIGCVSGLTLPKIDMFFFPLRHDEHYYVICIDLKHNTGEIIDNSVANDCGDDDTFERYADVPPLMVKLITQYLRSNGQTRKAAEFARKVKTLTRLRMPWRNDKNKYDGGIYTMRHMETYKGGGLKDWKCGLRANNDRQIQLLRTKYCNAILTTEWNMERDKIQAAAFGVGKKIAVKNSVIVDKFKLV